MHKDKPVTKARTAASVSSLFPKRGYDPEMLYVECSRCGAPIPWEPGQTAKILRDAGISPLELDASCVILSDGCPSLHLRGFLYGLHPAAHEAVRRRHASLGRHLLAPFFPCQPPGVLISVIF